MTLRRFTFDRIAIAVVTIALVLIACSRSGRGSQPAGMPTATTASMVATAVPVTPSLSTAVIPTDVIIPIDIPTAAPAPGAAANAAGYAPGDYVESITVNGQVRRYRLHIPPAYNPGSAMPLVVNLHGYNSNAEQQERVSQMSKKADQAGFIAVYPEGLGDPQTWHVGPRAEAEADLQFIRDLVEYLKAQLNIAPRRIYATGISNGAQMSNRLGCEMSDVFAAIAPVSGGYPPSQECSPVRPVPVVAFHGTADRLIPYEGLGRSLMPAREWAAAWANRNGCDPTPAVSFQHGEVTGETWGNCREGAEVVLYTIYGRGHSWPGSDMPPEITTQDINATDVIWDFFAAHPQP